MIGEIAGKGDASVVYVEAYAGCCQTSWAQSGGTSYE